MQRTVKIPARGKRPESETSYEAPENLKQALNDLGPGRSFDAILFFLDNEAIQSAVGASSAYTELLNNFHGLLKFAFKMYGEAAIEKVIAGGGFESLNQEDINEVIESVKNPPERKKSSRKPKADTIPTVAS